MAYNIKTTEELFEQFLATFEKNIGQTSPILPRSFQRVMAALESGAATELFKYATERALQNLALTATGEDLDIIGRNYNVIRKAAVAAQVRITQPATTGTTIPTTITYTGDSNNVIYRPLSSAVAVADVATVDVQAAVVGTAGNLVSGDTLTIGTQIAGILSTSAAFLETIRLGTAREDDEAYRRRILNEIGTVGGGSNSVDYRTWSEAVEGVKRAFPFAGAPVGVTAKLKDSDMDLPSTLYWSSGNLAALSKQTLSGDDLYLRVEMSTLPEPYAYQGPLTIGREYSLSGDLYGDGTFKAQIEDSGGQILWTGTVSTSQQSFSLDFFAEGIELQLKTNINAAGEVRFNNFKLRLKKSYPGDRVIYIESDEGIDPDGISPQSLLNDVRADVLIDPSTGKSRPSLGTTDEYLFIESIIRSSFDLEIYGLVVDSSLEADAKAAVNLGADDYFRSVVPYVEGADSQISRNDQISSFTLSQAIQEILDGYGATAQEIKFKKTGGSFVTLYTVAENELSKLGSVTYP